MAHLNDHHRTWRRSSRCASTACIEIALGPTTVSVRDSEHPTGVRLDFTAPAWNAFLDQLRRGGLGNSRETGDAER
jgi:hypothetical protein